MKKSAFSLVEILISLVVLTFGIVSLINLFPLSIGSIAYSRKLGDVALLAQQKFEELKSAGAPQTGTTSGKEEDLEWKLTVAPVSLPGNVSVVQAELDVDFTFQKGAQAQKFITYVYTNSTS